MEINESKLQNIIAESIQKNLLEYRLKNTIKRMVRESIYDMGGFDTFESEESGEDEREADEKHETKQQSSTRRNVISYFKRDGVDHAPYAYKLYGVKAEEGKDTNDMKNARHKFECCLNGTLNSNGYPYSFSSQEINTLKSLTSDNQL